MNETGWDALAYWGKDAARVERLTGGVANDVWSVRINGELAVARLGRRSYADRAWEARLMQHLDREGLTVPVFIPTADGRPFVEDLTVMKYMAGKPPASAADWRRVADTLRRVHQVTQDWEQRPGWASSHDLLSGWSGTKVDLRKMPPEAVARCRAAWARLVGRNRCVVHGNPASANNVFVSANTVALIDWDEAHVDYSEFDLVLPHNAAGLDVSELDLAGQASAAWDAAICWDDEHAKSRLAEVRAL